MSPELAEVAEGAVARGASPMAGGDGVPPMPAVPAAPIEGAIDGAVAAAAG